MGAAHRAGPPLRRQGCWRIAARRPAAGLDRGASTAPSGSDCGQAQGLPGAARGPLKDVADPAGRQGAKPLVSDISGHTPFPPLTVLIVKIKVGREGNGVRKGRLWRALLGVERTVVQRVELDETAAEPTVVAHVRPVAAQRSRCGVCRRRRPGYDPGTVRRRWRSLDLGTVQVVVEADAPRVRCPEHGVVVAAVPWARHGAGHTYGFDDQVAWLAVRCSKSAVRTLMRIAWRTVGTIVTRVAADARADHDHLAGLRRIGIDEISYKKGHRYLTVVVDHDTRRLVWAAPGKDSATLLRFFDALGPDRCAQISHVSADAANWIAVAVAERCPNAVRCADPFHVVAWATDALDQVRRQAWNDARALARTEPNPERAAARRRQNPTVRPRCSPSHPPRPLRAMEEPGEPDRQPTRQAGLGGQDRSPPLPRLPAQGRPPAHLQSQRRRRQTRPGPVVELGSPLPHPRLPHRTPRGNRIGCNADSAPPGRLDRSWHGPAPTASRSRSPPRAATTRIPVSAGDGDQEQGTAGDESVPEHVEY